MASLIPCTSCQRLHARAETACPFCGAKDAGRTWRGCVLGAMAMGLTLGGCIADESDTMMTGVSESETAETAGEATYGGPAFDTETETFGDADDGTTGSSSGGTTIGDTESATDAATDTDTDTDTDAGSSSSGASSSSGGSSSSTSG